MHKRIMRVLTCSLILSLLLSGIIPALVLSAEKTVEVTLWDVDWSDPVHSSMKYFVPWFEKYQQHILPGISVSKDYGPSNYPEAKKKFIIQAKTGYPDIRTTITENCFTFLGMDLVEPLTDRFNAWDEKGQFYESAIKAVTVEGEIVAIPYNVHARALLYRKDIFAQLGLTPPQTWKELIDFGSKITANVPDMYGFAIANKKLDPRAFQSFMSWFYQVNGRENLFKKVGGKWTVNATPEKLTKVLQLYYDLLFATDPPAMNPGDRGLGYPGLDSGYEAGRFAMAPEGPWMEHYTVVPQNSDVTPLPTSEGVKPAAYMEVEVRFMNKFSKNKDETWKFLQYLLSSEIMSIINVRSGDISPRKDAVMTEWQAKWAKLVPLGVSLAPVVWDPVRVDIGDAVDKVTYKQGTPAEVGKWLYEQLKEKAKQF